MTVLSHTNFLKTLPKLVLDRLPKPLQGVKVHQPYRWLLQFHFGEPRLHYEISSVAGRKGWEVGFHFEARDKRLNRFLLEGFRRNLFELKDTLGEAFEAEMWDRGWSKLYVVMPNDPLTEEFQEEVAQQLVDIMSCCHPIFVELRGAVMETYR